MTALRTRFNATDGMALVGISMGGYGALKIAFARSDTFAAVAAVAPMLEPSMQATGAPLRNRYHYPAEVPAALLGDPRDRELCVGPSVLPRLLQAFAWVGQQLTVNTDAATNTDERALRDMLAEVRQQAIAADPTFTRHYGVLRAR